MTESKRNIHYFHPTILPYNLLFSTNTSISVLFSWSLYLCILNWSRSKCPQLVIKQQKLLKNRKARKNFKSKSTIFSHSKAVKKELEQACVSLPKGSRHKAPSPSQQFSKINYQVPRYKFCILAARKRVQIFIKGKEFQQLKLVHDQLFTIMMNMENISLHLIPKFCYSLNHRDL